MKKFLAFLVALVFFVAKVEASELVIFHTNDMHSRVLNSDDRNKSIGLAEIAAAVKAAKAENPSMTLWFDAGDTFHGLPRINVSNGENMIPLLNAAGVDIVVPGNHDFNYGVPQLKKISKKLKSPLLSANVTLKKNGKNILKSYKILKLADGTRVGVFGLTTPETVYKASQKHVATVNFENPVVIARDMIKKLQPKCDVIVCIMHMGVDPESEFTSERIAREAPGIDVIIDGHSHTELPQGIQIGDTLIAQTGCYEHNLGRVTVEIENHEIISKKAELLNAAAVANLNPTPDAEIKKILADIEEKNKPVFNEVVAHSTHVLTSDRKIIRCNESELGNFIADMIRWRTGADFAIMNTGGIRADIPAGNVTRGDVMNVFPFGNVVTKAEISGSAIRQMLEHSVHAYPKEFSGFLSVSGLTFTLDASQPAGSRVSEIYIGGEILDENKIYTIGADDFLFMGGDGFGMLKGLKITGEFETMDDVLTDYLEEVGLGNISLGRIKLAETLAKAA
ncbi:MAG: bifunctional metallophosphatase/5'-nucleotidase [Selenomonadaceae bacterium]|nr:bifunctional metallophosphatase/5'-nucleotidase [Selenomonadaceae bacterium]